MSAMGPAVRIGDREREEAVASLSRHATAGRLSADELEERVEVAYRARTAGELDVLFADLPADSGAVGRPRSRVGASVVTPAIVLLAIATAASFALGYPLPPLWLVAWFLWRRAARASRDRSIGAAGRSSARGSNVRSPHSRGGSVTTRALVRDHGRCGTR
jgi:Domain of unknown function (DUF1707)